MASSPVKKRRVFGGLIYFIFLMITGGCLGLRDVQVTVPSAALRGDTAILECHFDLEGDTLYSVKWYKGRREFYRYTPKEEPALKVFPIQGLNVDKRQSNDTTLILRKLELSMSGRYSCEVSADAPSFHTSLVSSDMVVVEVPREPPSITGARTRYRIGDVLHSNCSSSWSMPASKLNWLVNDDPALLQQLIHYAPIRDRIKDREKSLLGLRFTIQPNHFEGGRLKIRCTASIYNVYWQSIEKSVEEDRPKIFQQETVGPDFIPHFPDSTSMTPRFYDELDDEYSNVDEFPSATTSACECNVPKRHVIVALFVLMLVIMR